jgi:hypothetical protein
LANSVVAQDDSPNLGLTAYSIAVVGAGLLDEPLEQVECIDYISNINKNHTSIISERHL